MDPALWELFEGGAAADEVSVIVRMAPGADLPATIRVVSLFGDICTGRVRRGDIAPAREAPGVISLKAGSIVTPPPLLENVTESDELFESDEADHSDEMDEAARPATPRTAAMAPVVTEDGRGVVVGICDWGFDFTHANFRNADGTTRLLCLWDQRGGPNDPLAPAPYNQGRLLTREMVNAALREADPCAALGYHPASGDPNNSGSHGTHVADILAGNRREPGSEVGLASAADIVFVHLATPQLDELGNLGDSVGLLEGLDFIRRQAAGRPCVLHLSAGKTGGPHRGDTLLERAVDAMLEAPGIALVQSVGNYANTAMHTHARVGPDQSHTLSWITPVRDRTPNELEIWYSGHDVFEVTLVAPTGRAFTVPLGNRLQLREGETVWGNFYHRLREPNSGLNHVVVYLYTAAPSGNWQIVLRGRDVVDGRLHAWIERDAGSRHQSRFPRSQASSRYTTNTICNCFLAIAVGAYDGTQRTRPPTRFTSRGPTADGRQKPEVAAPGYRVLAARSLPRRGWNGERRLCVKSGTSMAAPSVSGTVALMMAAAERPLTIHEIRRALIGSADPHPGPSGRTSTQLGYGYLNTAAAVAAARRIGQQQPQRQTPSPATVEHIDVADDLIVPPETLGDAELDEGQTTDGECGCHQRAAEVRAALERVGLEQTELEEASNEAADAFIDIDEATAGDQAAEAYEAAEDDALQGWNDDDDAPFADTEESEAAPVEWEDVRDALEAVDENDVGRLRT